MKQLKQWIRDHPFLSILFTFLFTLTAAVLGASSLTWPYAFFVVLILVFLVVYSRDAWLMTALLLTFGLATAPIKASPPPERKAIGAYIAVVVICGGGYCVYKLVKFCQKHFPKESPKTNSPPEIASQEMGASFVVAGDGCDDGESVPTTFTLAITPGEPPTMTASANHEAQSLDGFRKEMDQHGLDLDAPYSSTGGSFAFTNGIVASSAAGITVTIERSVDLNTWEPLLTVRSDKPFSVVDTTAAKQTFYRIR